MARKLNPWLLLAAGSALLIASQTRWGVGALAWLAPVPWLAALRVRHDRRFLWAFTGTALVAWVLATLKIVTQPVPAAIALGYGVPLAIVHLPPYFLWSALARRGRAGLAIAAFAASSALLEWAQAELTPFGVWGAMPSTQIGQLAIVQLVSLVGMPGLSFLMHAVAAAIEAAVFAKLDRRIGWSLAAVTAASLLWGSVRAVAPIDGPEARIALLRTDSTVGGLPIPPAERLRRDHETLLERTRAAAAAGAQLVIWPEAANLILPDDEQLYMTEASATAREHEVELVVSYIMLVSTDPIVYENRARWFAPNGSERTAYLKYHPVPGEPAVKGDAPAPTLATTIGLATLAICYDYDFPALVRVHARSAAGLVALPSSDWRGIDPIHTEMAAMRAVEGGFSIARSTRFGLSAGIDAHGRLRAQLSTNETREPFLMTALPTQRIATLYASLGNLVLAPLALVLTWALYVLAEAAMLRRFQRRLEDKGASREAATARS
jgi:apolipoprotein N-acyltransferase